MKKFIVIILLMSMLFALCSTASATNSSVESGSTQQNDIVRAARICNVGSDSSKLRTNRIDNGANEVLTSSIEYHIDSNGNLTFSGSINNTPFSVTAIPFNSLANENVQVYNGEEKLGHYQVLYVAVEKDISNSVKYFDTVNCSPYSYMIKLYMRTSQTDDIVIVEIFTNQNYFNGCTNRAAVVSPSESESGKIEQFWYAKVFEPIETYEDGPAARYLGTHENEGTYTYTFNHLGATYYQYFVLWRYISWPQAFENLEDFQTALEVKEAYTEVPGYPNENSESTYMRVDSVQINVVVGEGDAVSKISFDGLTHKNANASVTLKFDNTIPLWGPLSLKVNYENAVSNYDLNTFEQQLTNGGNRYYRQQGAALQQGHRLERAGHYFSVIWKIGNYSGAKTGQPFSVLFNYSMTNILDYAHSSNGAKTYMDIVYYNTY